jgi:hypothetical protein
MRKFFPSSGNELDTNLTAWPDDWAIAIYTGDSPFTLVPSGNLDQPVLTRLNVSDITAAFVADPFMIKVDDVWYMFFEAMNQKSRKGEIGLATSEDGLTWSYRQIVLAEPYHLSYPYVFEWMNEYYMIPESHMAGAVRLYKASRFPTEWSFAGTLLAGLYYADSSILRYDDRWWLFTDASPDARHNTLRLFWTDHLAGSWLEHPQSPIILMDPHSARPAGRLIVFNGRPVRFAQDCYPNYGTRVRAFAITELTTTRYREREVSTKPVIEATGSGWNLSGMHHVDPHPTDCRRWIACVDGFAWKESIHQLK